MKIVTICVYPPISIRSFDWVAHYDEPEGPTGHGKTEIDAINDLVANHPRGNVDCPDCDGKGRLFGIECANCDGSGIQPIEGGPESNRLWPTS